MMSHQEIVATVADLTHEGLAVVKYEDKVFFIAGALPGEEIRFKPSKKRKGKYEGELIEVMVPSEFRVDPKCEFYSVCGGCSLQHLDAQKQIEYKQKILFDNLTRIGKVTVTEMLPPIQNDIWGYRRKARPGIKHVIKKEAVLVGFREKLSNFITTMDYCETLHPSLAKLIMPLREVIATMSQPNQFPQVEMAVGDNDSIMLILRHLQALSEQDVRLLKEFANKYGVILMSQSKGPNSVISIWPEEATLLTYTLPQYDVHYQFRADDFIQVNASVNETMIDQAIKLLDLEEQDKVLDLFCGLGNFSLPLAKNCQTVFAIEGDQALVDKAVVNAKSNQISNVAFLKQDLYAIQAETHFADWPLVGINKVLLDPPRSGAKDMVERLIPKIQPERIVYVSCNPSTLARDADILVNQHGYTLEKAGVVDMFAHTAHVESMALFVRNA